MREKRKFKIVRTFDKALVHKLHLRIFPGDDWFDGESIDWIVYAASGQPVGFCMLSPVSKTTGYLQRAGVIREYQGLGLHRRMILARERCARALGFTELITHTKLHNIRSSVNLQRAGYVLYVPEAAQRFDDNDCLYWRKALKKN